ncbi:hypothetical protein ACYFX5_11805 [Bremerella sp. T1]|uniref:hypothetical protein n=1 Tax=Bremerella sp. TYQ1 TaxID=3119568 RepID=UPI001CCA3738|nr:hypothetical protein [Bremerella volcania]UBM33757.1 hypothetical protein LA756_13750 [Bremerella volcania]
MFRMEVAGSPVGGEDAKEKQWMDQIATANDLSNVILRFQIEPNRNVHLDNLVRPAMHALKRAGYYHDGFRELNSIAATRAWNEPEGLVVESGFLNQPRGEVLDIEWRSVPPSESAGDWKQEWTNAIAESYNSPPISQPAWVAITTTSRRSLVDLLGPIINGLEPLLGRDPAGSNPFSPNANLIQWLHVRRVEAGEPLRLVAGLL